MVDPPTMLGKAPGQPSLAQLSGDASITSRLGSSLIRGASLLGMANGRTMTHLSQDGQLLENMLAFLLMTGLRGCCHGKPSGNPRDAIHILGFPPWFGHMPS